MPKGGDNRPKPQEARPARDASALFRQALGDHVEHVVARLFIRGAGEARSDDTHEPIRGDFERYVVAGCMIGRLPLDALKDEEMWECDVILIPRRRWRGFPERSFLRRCRIDQILNGGFNEEGNYLQAIPVVEGEDNRLQEPQPNPDIHEDYREEARPRGRRGRK